ncbi:peptidoglycan-binding domain-containing protein [Streptomyces sp. R-07]|uniref:peptidoglycan-binding domain-containing protein n=1 Tax=Streptomyces sp. R-07 TaxID=3404052 RepID=UPI003CEE893B
MAWPTRAPSAASSPDPSRPARGECAVTSSTTWSLRPARGAFPLAALAALLVLIGLDTPAHALAGASVPTRSKGNRGSDVTALQYLLNGQGAQLAADGVFGAGTDTAVRSFQSSRGLDADGIVGPDTWWALVTGSSGGSGGLQAGLRRDQLPQHLGHRHVRPLRHPR